MTIWEQPEPEGPEETIRFCSVRPVGDDRFEGVATDRFGDRVFGGVIVAQALSAAIQTAPDDRPAHSLHGSFLRPERAGVPVDAAVERVRDGRTFSTRRVVLSQEGKDVFHATVSFHGDDVGDEYQLAMPSDVPSPDEVDRADFGPPPFEFRELELVVLPDGTYRSSHRAWARSTPLPHDPHVHLVLAGFLSDMTRTSFRPLRLGEWGHSADASIDHVVWFHRPFRLDDWVYEDFHALVNTGGRALVRGSFYSRDGQLCMSMAQELLIRPVEPGAGTLG